MTAIMGVTDLLMSRGSSLGNGILGLVQVWGGTFCPYRSGSASLAGERAKRMEVQPRLAQPARFYGRSDDLCRTTSMKKLELAVATAA
jgi:hypothetical protein